MNCDILTGIPPKTVSIDGKEYDIRSDFKTGIQFEKIIRSDLSEMDKCIQMLQLYYPKIPANLPVAITRAIWFYRCGNEEREEDKERVRYKRRSSNEPVCVFSQDAPYIYAAFLEQYGIDLESIEYMHWWKFMALFESLGDNTKMSKIMYYRSASTSGMSKEKRAFINDMKKLYRVKNFNSNAKMTLEKRNRQWRDYVKKRFEQG